MNTAIVPLEPKRVVSVEILHLDVLGYGPEGIHTRREWRAECLKNLLTENEQFEAWQASWKDKINKALPDVRLGAVLTHEDGTTEEILNGWHETVSPETLDFVARTFKVEVNAFDFVFTGYVDFSYTTFKRYANFSHTTFTGDANFSHTTFIGDGDFSFMTFTEYADFSFATFIGDVDFSYTRFTGSGDFSIATFTGGADFGITTFTGDAKFFKTKFINQCLFQESYFGGEVNFENAEIENVGHFENGSFKNGELPNFLGVDNSKTLLVFSNDDNYFNKKDTQGNATDRIAQLKRLAEEQGQIDQMLMFNAFELNAKAKQPNASWVLKIVTGLYSIVSDYGRSFIRPIIFYGLLIWLSFLYSFGYFVNLADISEIHKHNCKSAAVEQKLDLSRERAAVEYALFRAGGVFDFTDTGKQNNAVNCRLFEEPIEPPLMRAWGIFKGIASIALLFLAALGLRNKYRIK